MKACVLCSFYLEGYGYLENMMAKELARQGHEVVHVAAGPLLSRTRRLRCHDGTCQAVIVPSFPGPRTMRFAPWLAGTLRELAPDFVFWVGPTRHFGRCLVSDPALRQVPVVTFHSENPGMHEYDWRKCGLTWKQRIHALGYGVLRGRLVRLACRRANLINATWKSTQEILLGQFPLAQREAIARKIVCIPQGYDQQVYSFREDLSARVRKELGIPGDSVVVVASSRFAEGRKKLFLGATIQGVLGAVRQAPSARAIIVGFCDNEVSRHFSKLIASDPAASQVICQPWASQERLNELYNAADIAVFGNTTVSAPAAVGTGLVACLADTGAMDPLVTVADQGFFFALRDVQGLTDKLARAMGLFLSRSPSQRAELRQGLVRASRWLGYDRIVTNLLSRLFPAVGAGA